MRKEIAETRTNSEAGIASVRKEIAETRANSEVGLASVRKDLEVGLASVRKDMATMKYDFLRWQVGIALGLGLIMAKGFGWLGF